MTSRFARKPSSLVRYWRELLLLCVTIVVTLLVFEAAYRFYQYHTLPGRLFALVDSQVAAGHGTQAGTGLIEKIPDAYTGYLYAPNHWGQRGHPWYSHWRTNSHGHVSRSEYGH